MTRKHKPATVRAYHEAGHAVVAFVLRRSVRGIDITDSKGHGPGRCSNVLPRRDLAAVIVGDRGRWDRKWLEQESCICLAGMAAQKDLQGNRKGLLEMTGPDTEYAADLLDELCVIPEELNRYTELIYGRALTLVQGVWPAVESLAAVEYAHVLSSSQVYAVLVDALNKMKTVG